MAARRTRNAPRILGITGPIGCGKTTVGDILLELGATERIDADRVVHELQRPGTEVTRAIAESFGQDVLNPDGSVNRARLGALVFADPAQLARLEAIVHPAVRQAVRARIESIRGGGVIVVDAVKLLQSDLLELVSEVWVIQCSAAVERDRLVHLRGLSAGAADTRIAAQPQFDNPRVTRVIDNTGSLEDLRRQIQAAWEEFRASPSE